MGNLVKDLVLYWKRGIGIYLAMLVVTYLIGVILGIGQEIMTTLGRGMSIAGVWSVLLTWIANPIIAGWVASLVVQKIKK